MTMILTEIYLFWISNYQNNSELRLMYFYNKTENSLFRKIIN